jgi:5-methylcytosine-specific restriction endonuclease McrA
MGEMKACSRCGLSKPLSEFSKRKDTRDGLQSWCKVCKNEVQKRWQREHAQELNERQRKLNKAKRGIRHCRICGEECKGRSSVYCSDECIEENNRRRCYVCDKAKKVLRQRKCRGCGKIFIPEYGNKKHIFCSNKCGRKYGQRIGKAVRRTRMNGAPTENIHPNEILKRDGYRCYVCGCKTPKRLRNTYEDNAPEVDHIIPVSKGGGWTWDNLACICRKCNINKTDRTLEELGWQPALQIQIRLT